MAFYVTFERAIELILKNVKKRLPAEIIPLTDALNRVLAEEIVADRSNPPIPLSAMDGYAVNHNDVSKLPTALKIISEIPAGKFDSEVEVKQQEAAKVYTGSPIPKGANAVVPVEDAKEENGKVLINSKVKEGQNIRKTGEDYHFGEVLLSPGTVLSPPEIALIASAGKIKVSVTRKPSVAIVVTGDEIVEPEENPINPSSVRNTNAYSLISMVEESGGIPHYLGIVKDNPELTKLVIDSALKEYDVVITSGGVSTGKYDFVKEAVKEIGLNVIFYKAKVKPGKPALFGERNSKFFFALPGFPVSTIVSFYLFVYPLLKKLLGASHLFKPTVKAVLIENYSRKKAERKEFARCIVRFNSETGNFEAIPCKKQGSGVLTSITKGTGLLIVPEKVRKIPKGSYADIILLKPFFAFGDSTK